MMARKQAGFVSVIFLLAAVDAALPDQQAALGRDQGQETRLIPDL
jgi:hypothetical protein